MLSFCAEKEPFFFVTIPAGPADVNTGAAVDTTRFAIAPVVANMFVPVVFLAASLCRDDEVVLFGSFRPILTGIRPPFPPPAGAAVVVVIIGTVVAGAAAASAGVSYSFVAARGV